MVNLTKKSENGICINHKLVNIMAKAGVPMKDRREYITTANICLYKSWAPEMLYNEVESFVKKGFSGCELSREIKDFFYKFEADMEIAAEDFGSKFQTF